MNSLRSLAVLVVVVFTACGTMTTQDAGTGGGGGTATGGGSATGGGGGTSGGGSATGGGGGGPAMANCSTFPATIALGDSIVANEFGAVICNSAMANFCRVTNNTYSDACGGNDDFFLSQNLMTGARRLYIRDQQEWTFVSKTHGDPSPGGMYEFRNLPADTDITFVVRAGGVDYDFIFKFVGSTVVVTKFGLH